MRKIKLLVVDDEIAWSQPFKDLLESTEVFQVEIEPYGSEAPRHAHSFEPDIILIDWGLEHEKTFGASGDGIAVAHKLRTKHPEFDKIPILIITQRDPDTAIPVLGSNYEAKGIYITSKDSTNVMLAYIGYALFRWTQQVGFVK